MSRLLSRSAARVSQCGLRGQTSWYNNATDRLAMEIRQASQARHQATDIREKKQLERLELAEKDILPTKSVKMEVHKPNSGELLTYRPPNEQDEDKRSLEAFPHLSRKKMRALVRLYNQSESWLTPETLDRHIEEEFAISPQVPAYLELELLKRDAEKRNAIPEMSIEGLNGIRRVGVHTKRGEQIDGALWGIDGSGNPDLEAVEEVIEGRRAKADEAE
ncbi:hypothetical protein FRC19_002294 [Serendipita sp. 401]|nr:hypothetical protein FRC19_002294 [Serendipita sp. 401]